MISPLANLFLALQDRITSLADSDGKKYFTYIDQDFGQLEYQPVFNRPAVSWPCILIDLDNARIDNLVDNVQTGTIPVILRLGFPPFSPSSNGTPQQYKEKAIYYYYLEQILHMALQGWCPGDQAGYEALKNIFGKFIRTNFLTERREDSIRVRAITYTISMEDYSTKPTMETVPRPALDLNVGIDTE